MTTRNFRVNNGISVGDIVISASTNKITGLSTAAPTADGDVANKKYVDDGLAGLSQNSITQGNSNVTVTDAGTGSITVAADGATRLTVAAAGVTVANALTASDTVAVTGAATLSSTLGVTGNTTLSGDLSLTGSNKTVTLSPTGTGTVAISPAGALTINPTAASTINNTSIGATTAASGAFTTLSASSTLGVTGAATLSSTLAVTGAASFAGNMTVGGNLTVSGTQTILNTQVLDVADNLIGINTNITDSANMPRFSGLHIHRGSGSSATDQDVYFLWDDAFNDDASSIYGAAAGGAFTAIRSTHNEDSQLPNDDFGLADIRCRVINATATSAQYADIAERFAADAPMTEGAVVMLGGAQEITETGEELSDQVFGVISSKPAYMMNAGAGNNQSHPFVAMTGRTPVRVTGVVNKGDRLVSSSVKGTARAAKTGESINPFHVIGRALESKSDTGIGMVNCFVQANN